MSDETTKRDLDAEADEALERFPAKWIPVRVKKTRQTKT